MSPKIRQIARYVVVAVEGQCFAGKSRLVRQLGQLPAVGAVPEYAELADLPPFPPQGPHDVAAALEHFLAAERSRATRLPPKARFVVCDRSPLSLITYEHGAAALGIPADPAQAAEMFSAAATRGEILTPDAYIHLHVDSDLAQARQRRRGPVRPHLMNPLLRSVIDAAYAVYYRQLPPWRLLRMDPALSPDATTARATTFLAGLPRVVARETTPPTWPHRPAMAGSPTLSGGQR